MEPHFLFMNDVQILPDLLCSRHCIVGVSWSVQIPYTDLNWSGGNLGRIDYPLVS